MADGKAAGTPKAAKASDLKARTLTACVMLVVAGSALWLGGWVWIAFVAAVSLGVLWEWRGLVIGFVTSPLQRALWNVAGFAYVGLAGLTLALLRTSLASLATVLALLLAVIATDIGAYFAGRAIGGPKIAPRISPSKTWAGLGGGILGAGLVLFAWLVFGQYMLLRSIDLLIVPADRPDMWQNIEWLRALRAAVPGGIAVAVVAQAGDFFESWMKRRAGVKDSGALLPGHGGLFDRVDGLLAVLFTLALAVLAFGFHDYLRVA